MSPQQTPNSAPQYASPDGIIDFVRNVLNADPTPYQEDILRQLVIHKRVAVRGPHGIGKTSLAAWIVLWSMVTFEDVKAVTTASAWRQLEKFLWPELRKWAMKVKWAELGLDVRRGRELLDLSFKLEGKEAFAVASDNPALIEGTHASVVVYILDEAKAIPNDTWDSIEGAFSMGDVYALAISTPGDTSGRFFDIHSHRPGYEDWMTRHVTLEEAIAAGRISPKWVEQRKKQWGESSAVYQNRVLGEFAVGEENTVIPLAWIEAANRRWYDCQGKGAGHIAYGIDPAYTGDDKTAIARLVGTVIEQVDSYAKQDTMQTAGRVAAQIDKQTPAAIDVIGVGAGVFDRLREQGYAVQAVNVSHATDLTAYGGTVSFVNLRSAVWWLLHEALDPDGGILLALPPDDVLTGDLTAPRWSYTSDGKIKVESKPDIRARLGRSPDKADAVVLAWYASRHISASPISFA